MTYSRKDMVDSKCQVGDRAEFEDGLPSELQFVQVVDEDGNEASDKVGSDNGSKSDQSLLSDEAPRGVADAHEDWLHVH